MIAPAQIPRRQWRWLSLLFLSLLPLLAVFHLVMWQVYTRHLFRPETGDMKRLGYLVGLEDRRAVLAAAEPKTGFTVVYGEKLKEAGEIPVFFFGDSFAGSLARAYSLKTGLTVGAVPMNWQRKNGLSQIEAWLKNDWFRVHGVKAVVLERVEESWLETFTETQDPSSNVTWEQELAGVVPEHDAKATPWTFANNGNYKVLICNTAYLFSPTAFKMTDVCMVPLKRKFFDCSYGNKLLFYRGDLRGALTEKNRDRFEAALRQLREISEECSKQGIRFYLVVPPVKSYLYYDWVDHPFYPDSKLLEKLQERATGSGYIDLKGPFRQKLKEGYQDLYYADDLHWNFPAAQMAADELVKAGVGQ